MDVKEDLEHKVEVLLKGYRRREDESTLYVAELAMPPPGASPGQRQDSHECGKYARDDDVVILQLPKKRDGSCNTLAVLSLILVKKAAKPFSKGLT